MNKLNVILTTEGNISETDRAALKTKGFLVVECKDPEKVKFIDENQVNLGSTIAEAALKAISTYNHSATCNEFISRLSKAYSETKS